MLIFGAGEESEMQLRLGMAELVFTVHKEAAFTLLDFFERRTGRLYFNIGSIEILKKPALAYMTEQFSWDRQKQDKEINELERAIQFASSFN